MDGGTESRILWGCKIILLHYAEGSIDGGRGKGSRKPKASMIITGARGEGYTKGKKVNCCVKKKAIYKAKRKLSL